MTAPELQVFRIVTSRRAVEAFSGEGARLHGGRWNPKGIRVVYTASSRALAILEMLAQDEPVRARYVIIPARIPPTVRIERVSPSRLPAAWSSPGSRDDLRAIGTEWVRRAKAAVLSVPSAVVPNELNYLLNPAHPEFGRIKPGRAEALATDARLLQRLSESASRKAPV